MADTFPVRVRVVIEYTTDLVVDPKAYGGAKTPDAIMAKEKRYLEEGGDYLISGLQFLKHTASATVEHADEACNCQAIPGTPNYPGPWRIRGDAPHYPCAKEV